MNTYLISAEARTRTVRILRVGRDMQIQVEVGLGLTSGGLTSCCHGHWHAADNLDGDHSDTRAVTAGTPAAAETPLFPLEELLMSESRWLRAMRNHRDILRLRLGNSRPGPAEQAHPLTAAEATVSYAGRLETHKTVAVTVPSLHVG